MRLPVHAALLAFAVALPCASCSSDSSSSSPDGDATDGPDIATDTNDDVHSPNDDADNGDADGAPHGSIGTLAFVEVDVQGGLGAATDLIFVPGTNELLVLELDGRVIHLGLTESGAERRGEFRIDAVHSELDCGLLSAAVDPDFAANNYLYLGFCSSARESAIFRYTFDPSNYGAIEGSGVEIIRVGDPEAPRPWHNVGSIGFDPDGNLWALFGDKAVSRNGQDPSNNLGALVRIVPNRAPGVGGYTPAEGNPFVGDPERSDDIYAYGLRSPWKGLLDHQGRYWIGDVGAGLIEEVNIATEPGQNFGWNRAEGPCSENCGGLVDPVAYWDHSESNDYVLDDDEAVPASGRVVFVGIEYEDRGNDRYRGMLTNRVTFGEFCVGFVRLLEVDDQGDVVLDTHIGHQQHLSGWRQAPDGYVYASTFGACETVGLDGPPPSRLYRVERR